MEELIKDFTPFFTKEKTSNQRVNVKEDIANLLTLLNTHQLIMQGGAEMYRDKAGYQQIDLSEVTGYDLLDHKDLARFMSKTIAHMAEEAYEKGDVVFDIAKKLNDFDPANDESVTALDTVWKDNADMIQKLLYLYSEYIYKVFVDNPYMQHPVGLKTSNII